MQSAIATSATTPTTTPARGRKPETLRRLGILLGDDDRLPLGGTHCNRLTNEARFGRLQTLEDPNWITICDDGGNVYRREREHLTELTVERAAFREWIAEFGTDADRASPAAEWAGMMSNERRTR